MNTAAEKYAEFVGAILYKINPILIGDIRTIWQLDIIYTDMIAI